MQFRILLALLLIHISGNALAEAANPQPLTLDQVVVRVLEHNPQLGINDYESLAMANEIRKAAQGTPYELRLNLENIGGSGLYEGTDQLESTLSLAKVLERGNKTSLRRDVAQQQHLLLGNQQDSQRLDLLARASEMFIHVVIDQHRLDIARQNLTLIQQTYEMVRRRVSAGKSHRAEQRRMKARLVRAEIDLEHAEHELKTSRLKLTTLWASTQPDFSLAHANLFELPAVGDFSQLQQRLLDNPDLVRFATESRLLKAELKLAQSQSSSNIELAGGVRHFNEPGDNALVFSLNIPLGSSSRAKPEIERLQQLSQAQPLRYAQQQLQLHASLFQIYQELLHARTAYQALTEQILPETRQAAKEYREGYRAGRFSLRELNDAENALLEAQLERVLTAARYHNLNIEIERLTGASLNAENTYE